MKYLYFLIATLLIFGCKTNPRVVVSTRTTVGLHLTPGDLSTRPPQFVLAYKRSELAIIPTAKQNAIVGTNFVDCFSTLAAFDLQTTLSEIAINQFIATGIAARSLATNMNFGQTITNSIPSPMGLIKSSL